MFVIEDEIHFELIGKFSNRDEAATELNRLASLPWDHAPNVAPCTSWAKCGRNYHLIEYDMSQTPWRELSRTQMLEISADEVRWHSEG
ncbi:hypothetical protein [Microbacterium aoyamense]|uniref:hypothetical protein n=1 Tax=Microbacterium aoyamense TaxID=344166 RepID=UPI0020052B41|nr:hypothetical protein [Microbacterium aoyamense]